MTVIASAFNPGAAAQIQQIGKTAAQKVQSYAAKQISGIDLAAAAAKMREDEAAALARARSVQEETRRQFIKAGKDIYPDEKAFNEQVYEQLVKEYNLEDKIDPAKVANFTSMEKLKYICDLAAGEDNNSTPDPAVVNAFDNMYAYFANEGSVTDAKNVLMHKVYYLQGKYLSEYEEGKFTYDSVRDQDKTGRFENGYINIKIRQSSDESLHREMIENLIMEIGERAMPIIFIPLEVFEFAGSLGFDPYYEFNPKEILKAGDASVYYSDSRYGGSGDTYHFRGDNFLFSSNDGGGLEIKGYYFDSYVDGEQLNFHDIAESLMMEYQAEKSVDFLIDVIKLIA